jgi:superfamily II DNA or RNA helicase
MSLTRNFTRAHLVSWFDPETLREGEAYVDQVKSLRVMPDEISAFVQNPRASYYVRILEFSEHGIISFCSCSVGMDCAHAAAVLLHALALRQGTKEGGEAISPGVLSWVTDLKHFTRAVEERQAKRQGANRTRLFYRIENDGGEARIFVLKGMRPDAARYWVLTERALIQPPQFVEEDDLSILRLLWAGRNASFHQSFSLAQKKGAELLEKLLASRRFIAGDPPVLLNAGPPRESGIIWQARNRRQHPQLAVTPQPDILLPCQPPHYLDLERGEVGPLRMDLPLDLTLKILSLPPLSPREASLVAAALSEVAPEAPKPVADPEAVCRVVEAPLVCTLRLDTLSVDGMERWRAYPADPFARFFDYAEALVCYGEIEIVFGDTQEFITLASGEMVRVKRDAKEEARRARELANAGFEPVPARVCHCFNARRPTLMYGLAAEAEWRAFMDSRRKTLEAAGWKISHSPDFRHYYLLVESWEANLHEQANGWLDLDMGVIVEGRRLELAPLLAGLFQRDARWLDAPSLASISPDEMIELVTGEGIRLRVPAERLKPLARLLIDLFDGYKEGPLRISRFDATRLDILEDKSRWQFHGPDSVMALAKRLQESQGVREIAPPTGFRMTLRDYQRTGLSWLQYLAKHELAGILADDMGLGKTAQALAHLLLEKEAGRLCKPALVVLPTSLIFNWKNEAARFAPDLRVLSLHGQERKTLFARIPEHDVVLTTYPLLWRDGEMLQGYSYHFLILDEAQTVKNSRSKSASVVRQLQATHRLCLTGTPLENHLGELWAQFDFLLPGFLGDNRSFTRQWRNPIEKQGNLLRRELLAQRLRPFILRRKKDDVATELPPKTIIVRTVELTGAQRDLYETVRAAMDEKVRAEIALRGFKRSQIVILDALLKLRQVCCDPRLVKSSAAGRVKERAKLDLLMDMLPELVDEGRRVLVFSQFTAMLALIQAELTAKNLDHVLLTGDTRDRETPIQAFQSGKAPVFLISLKAGGVGLNLTAADTVIHYDPWWNPAVENQATDRAHRLGQDKPVFVYKLIVAGSIEEKILALQEKKAELAASILSETQQGEVKFGEADLKALFDPLP